MHFTLCTTKECLDDTKTELDLTLVRFVPVASRYEGLIDHRPIECGSALYCAYRIELRNLQATSTQVEVTVDLNLQSWKSITPDYEAQHSLEMGQSLMLYLDPSRVSELTSLVLRVEIVSGEVGLTVETSDTSWKRHSASRHERIELSDLGKTSVNIEIVGISISNFKIYLEPTFSLLDDPRLEATTVLYDDTPILLEPETLESLVLEYRPYWTLSEKKQVIFAANRSEVYFFCASDRYPFSYDEWTHTDTKQVLVLEPTDFSPD